MLKVEKINDSVTYIGALDPELKVFDIVMETKFGTTYNSYLIDCGESYVLVETAKEHYFDEYFENLSKICDVSKIKYLIMNHTEPDHSGEVHKLLEKIPDLTIVGTPTAIGFLSDIANKTFKSIEVKSGSKLNVGSKNFSFYPAPNLHWPDSMFTYLEEDKCLFSCDVFGAHYNTNNVFNDSVENKEDYMEAFKYYHDAIFGPFKGFVVSGLNKIEKLDISNVCCSHGPVLRDNINWYFEKYLEWAQDISQVEGKVAICYTSAYGYTDAIAREIAKGIESEGLDVTLVDLLKVPKEQALVEIRSSEGFLIGSPTINGDVVPPIWDLLLSLNSYDNCAKFTAAFGAYGWSGEAVRNIEGRLAMIKCEVFRPGLRIKFNPESDEKIKEAFDFGVKYAKKFLKLQRACDDEWIQIKTGKWKCLVCGEIYEGEFPPSVCPACGAPSDQFIEITDNAITFMSENSEKIVILGSGIAAVSCIDAIRARNINSSIEMITDEDCLPYNRVLLSKKLTSGSAISYLKDEKWFEEKGVKVSLSKKVSSINSSENKVMFSDGSSCDYTKLVIATGARCRQIPIHGDDKNGVFSLRGKCDYDKISSYMQNREVKNAVVIGGGILGVEMASELKKAGIGVTIVEFGPRLMARQIDTDAGKIFEKHICDKGINIKCGESVEEILGTGDGFRDVCGVRLSHSKENIDCQMIIASTGISANVEFLKDSGITINRGVIVDKYMKTNYDNIFACGDVTEFEGTSIGLWAIAIDQGKVAGANCVGDKEIYRQKTIATSFNGFDYRIFSIGDLGFDPHKNYQCLELSDPESEMYRKFYFFENEFVGGILMGDTSKAIQLRKAIDRKTNMQHFLDDHFLDW